MKNQINRSDWPQKIFHIQKINDFLTVIFVNKNVNRTKTT